MRAIARCARLPALDPASHRSLREASMLGLAREPALAAREAPHACARQCALWRSSLAAHTRLPCLAFAHAHSSIARGPRHKAGLLPCARAPCPCSLHSYRMGDELPCSSSHARTIQHPLRVTRSVHCFVRASYMNESHKNLKYIFKINDKLIN